MDLTLRRARIAVTITFITNGFTAGTFVARIPDFKRILEISIKVRVFVQLPSVEAKRALVRLSTQTFVGGTLGVTATATPPATTAPRTKPIMILLKLEIVLMSVT